MKWSSWSKHVFEREDSHAISCAISRQEKGGLHKCIARFITYSSPERADTWFPSLPRKECTDVRDVITKFSRMDGLPNFLTHGAPLARFVRRNSGTNSTQHLILARNSWTIISSSWQLSRALSVTTLQEICICSHGSGDTLRWNL